MRAWLKAHQEDVAQPTDGVEPGSEADVAPPSTEPNVVQPESEQPLSSLVAPTADATGWHSRSSQQM